MSQLRLNVRQSKTLRLPHGCTVVLEPGDKLVIVTVNRFFEFVVVDSLRRPPPHPDQPTDLPALMLHETDAIIAPPIGSIGLLELTTHNPLINPNPTPFLQFYYAEGRAYVFSRLLKAGRNGILVYG